MLGPFPERAARQAAQGPHPDRVVDDRGQAHATRVVTRSEADRNRDETEDDERPDDPFQELDNPLIAGERSRPVAILASEIARA